MRRSISIASIICLLSLTSCIDIIERIFLEKNGSGRYLMTFDMKSILTMKDLWLSKSPLGGKPTGKPAKTKSDTVIYFTNMSDSVRRKFKNPEWSERAFVRMVTDEEAGVMFATIELPFAKIGEVNRLLADLNYAANTNARDFGLLCFTSRYKVTKRSIERISRFETIVHKPDSLLGIAAAMMATVRMKTVFHLPGKIKSTTIPDAYTRDNECMVEATYGELIGKKKSVDGKIIFNHHCRTNHNQCPPSQFCARVRQKILSCFRQRSEWCKRRSGSGGRCCT